VRTISVSVPAIKPPHLTIPSTENWISLADAVRRALLRWGSSS
jgi:hypothetical protein